MARGNSSPRGAQRTLRLKGAGFREEMERKLSLWLDLPVPLRIRPHARARSVILKLTPDRGLEITIPASFNLAGLPYAVQEKFDWIERGVRRMMDEGRLPGSVETPKPERLVFTAFNTEYRLRYLDAASAGFRVAEMGPGTVLARGPLGEELSLFKALFAFARKKAAPLLAAGLRRVSEEEGLPFAGVGVRVQRARWGSCTAGKNISLNLKLAFLPWELARYVFLHELCHTRHLNHSSAYWKLVESREPDFSRLDKALRHAEEYVPLWMRLGLTAR